MTREAKRTALTCVGSDETLTGGLKLKLQPRRCMHLRVSTAHIAISQLQLMDPGFADRPNLAGSGNAF